MKADLSALVDSFARAHAGWDDVKSQSTCLHCMGSGLSGGGPTECGFCEQDQYFTLYPSSNNARHDVCGPYPSILEARAARVVSGDIVVEPKGHDYVVVRSFDALWDWEVQEAAFPSGDFLAPPFAFRHVASGSKWLKSDCDPPRQPKGR